jgi:predicted Rossmann fold flavoprotein
MPDPQHYDVIVLGAGAAGLFCAIHAGRGGRRVLVLEHADRIGKKILISGGGRCNFTHLNTTAANFISTNPHFAKSALVRFTPQDFLSIVNQHNIAWHEKSKGQLFCDGSAQQIVTLLEKECAVANVTINTATQINSVTHATDFSVATSRGIFTAASLVIATGGLSIPKLGATPFGYRIAEQFGHNIIPTRAGLVPLTFSTHLLADWPLPGIAAECIAAINKIKFRDKMLFTHRGISGPAILQISSYWQPGQSITLDLAPETQWTAPLRTRNALRDLSTTRTALYQVLPQRFADRWLKLHPPTGFTNTALDAAEAALHQWHITPAGTEGYEKAEVTLGGVDTNDLNAQSMQSRKLPGLFFIGEVVDVTGQLGGFNFQWAWASGAAAGRALAG